MILFGAVILAAVSGGLARPADDHHPGCNHIEKTFLKCFVDSGNSIFKALNTGDKTLGLPVLDPLEVKKMDLFNKGEHMHLEVMNSTHRGLGKTVIQSAQADLEHFTFKLNLTSPEYNIKGRYNMDTKIGMLPVVGDGDFVCTLGYLVQNYVLANLTMTWDVHGKPVEKNGKHYMEITDLKTSLHPKNMKVRINNLFSGNEELGENVNRFFNENWKEVFEQLRPAIEHAYGQLVKTIGSHLLEKTAIEDMFPDMHM